MKQELRERLEKYPGEVECSGDTALDLLNIAIWVVEAVKTHKLTLGYYRQEHIQAMDTTSTILRNSR